MCPYSWKITRLITPKVSFVCETSRANYHHLGIILGKQFFLLSLVSVVKLFTSWKMCWNVCHFAVHNHLVVHVYKSDKTKKRNEFDRSIDWLIDYNVACDAFLIKMTGLLYRLQRHKSVNLCISKSFRIHSQFSTQFPH